MDLQQIKYFLAVVDFGTFLAASEQVHVSQPTLSAGIRRLEESLDAVLFVRGSRAATLTAAGELFLQYARPAYTQLMSVKGKINGVREVINLGVVNTIPMDHIAEIIRVYKQACPQVYLELVVANHDELLQLLQVRKLDMVFTAQQLGTEKFNLLFEEQLNVVVSAAHPIAAQKHIELQQLSAQPFIERINCESWHTVHELFMQQNIQPHSVCRAESDESVLSLVAANLGVSIMPFRNTPYAVRFLPIKDLRVTRPIGVATAHGELAPHVQQFFETTRGLYRQIT